MIAAFQKYLFFFVLLISFVVINNSTGYCQTRQETLEAHFDFVETFDRLKDWRGTEHGDVSSINDMPLKSDNSASGWKFYSFYGKDYLDNWIKNHGIENTLGSSGKSLCLDYGGNKGPSRLGIYIGSSPSDGYEEVYVFFMNKYHKDFYPMQNETDFSYWGFYKTLDITTGFRDIWNWGTVEEQANAENSQQSRNIYGLNDFLVNITSGQSCRNRLKAQSNVTCSDPQGYSYIYEFSEIAWESDYSDKVLSNEWFGIEYRYKLSNPHNTANGEVEFWVYDIEGNIISHDIQTGKVTFRDPTDPVSHFDHKINKFVWGGNRDDYAQKGFLRGKLCSFNTSTDIITVTNHLRSTGDLVAIYAEQVYEPFGEIPTPLENMDKYYVIKVNDDQIKLASSYSDALSGNAVNITSTGSGSIYLSCISYLYIDDIVIHSSRIGPTYFSVIEGNVQAPSLYFMDK